MGQEDCRMGMIKHQIVLDTAIVKNKLLMVACNIRWIPIELEISHLERKAARNQKKAGKS